jgi:hypothetical protein
VRWTLDADEEVSSLAKSDPGNVDLLNTMPLPDSAANAGTPMPKNIADHQLRAVQHHYVNNRLTVLQQQH